MTGHRVSTLLLALAALVGVECATVPLPVEAQEFPHGTLPEGLDCLDCHTMEGWSPLRSDLEFDHGATTGFPLQGRHESASCRSCHEDLLFERASSSGTECGTCHLDVHSGALSTDCSLCHTPTSFTDVSGIRIHQNTGFPLEGAHLQLTCESCHSTDEGGAFSPLPAECLACHREDYQATTLVDHEALGFPENCLECHTPLGWSDVGAFDHLTFSGGYPLVEVHGEIPCTSCHTPGGGLRYSPSGPEDCLSCHQADYQEEHGGSGFPTNCALCHNQRDWEAADDFDHTLVSGGFQLLSAHQSLPCTSCHTPDGSGTLFNPAGPEDCVSCHLADYQEEHTGSGYPTDCALCHNASDWDGASSDHLTLSDGFALPPDHGTLACTGCHTPDGTGTLYDPAGPEDCLACHQGDYQGEHAGSGYPTDCTLCHTTSGWEGAELDHAAISDGFSLLGDHDLLPCTGCHVPGSSETLFSPSSPEDCLACHLGDFEREHGGSGYPTTCLTCHQISTWAGANFDHDAQFFPIYSGKHQGRWDSCQTCHTSLGTYAVFTCLNCHEHNKADTDADHSEVSGYAYESNLCLSCHPTGNS